MIDYPECDGCPHRGGGLDCPFMEDEIREYLRSGHCLLASEEIKGFIKGKPGAGHKDDDFLSDFE